MKVLSRIIDMIYNSLEDEVRDILHAKIEFPANMYLIDDAINRYALSKMIKFMETHVSVKNKGIFKHFENPSIERVFRTLNHLPFYVERTRIIFYLCQDHGDGLVPTISFYGLNARSLAKLFQRYIYQGMVMDKDPRNRNSILITMQEGSSELCYSIRRSKKDLPDHKNVIGPYTKEMVHVVDRFIHSRKVYEKYGILYNLKILIYGKQGTGKSTIAMAIAKKYMMDIYLINSKTDISSILRSTQLPPSSHRYQMIIIEELDIILKKYEKSNDGVDIIMQLLGGIGEVRNTVIIMTTNHIDQIDERIIRDRRVDYKIYAGNLTYDEISPMQTRFHLTENEFSDVLKGCVLDKDGKYNPANVESKILDYIKENKIV